MPKEATGELKILADGFAARITIIGRKRQATSRCRSAAARPTRESAARRSRAWPLGSGGRKRRRRRLSR